MLVHTYDTRLKRIYERQREQSQIRGIFQFPVTRQRVVIVPGGYPRHIGNISRLLPPLQLFWIEGDASAVHSAMLQKKAIQIVHLISIFKIEEDVQVKTEIDRKSVV